MGQLVNKRVAFDIPTFLETFHAHHLTQISPYSKSAMAKGLADLLDSDMEDSHDVLDVNSILSSPSEMHAAANPNTKPTQAKKGKKRHRVTMPKPKARVTKLSPAPRKATNKKTAATKRKVLEERVNEQEPVASGQQSEQEEIQAPQPPKPRARAPAKKNTKRTAQQEDSQDEMEVDQTPAVARSSHAPSRNAKTAPKPVSRATATNQARPNKTAASKAAILETQHEQTASSDAEDATRLIDHIKPRDASRQTSRMSQDPGFRRRAGSASDTERGDPNLRRKLGDVTRRFENVDLKYRTLKEVGIGEANANMEKLRRQCDATTQASNELIASLKKELAQQGPLAQDSRKLKKQVQTQESETLQLRKDNAGLSSSLAAAQNEIKALQAKLAAARSSSVAPESGTAKAPANNLKASTTVRPLLPSGSEGVHVAQMKEELYSDLTGLIIRSVKRAEDGDTYDCIQTGRNGSRLAFSNGLAHTDHLLALHFKLFVDAEDAKTSSFEQTDFLYNPLIDPNRDRDLIALMPDYLTEEITFARQDAAKFYGRVLDTLTKRRVEADDDT